MHSNKPTLCLTLVLSLGITVYGLECLQTDWKSINNYGHKYDVNEFEPIQCQAQRGVSCVYSEPQTQDFSYRSKEWPPHIQYSCETCSQLNVTLRYREQGYLRHKSCCETDLCNTYLVSKTNFLDCFETVNFTVAANTADADFTVAMLPQNRTCAALDGGACYISRYRHTAKLGCLDPSMVHNLCGDVDDSLKVVSENGMKRTCCNDTSHCNTVFGSKHVGGYCYETRAPEGGHEYEATHTNTTKSCYATYTNVACMTLLDSSEREYQGCFSRQLCGDVLGVRHQVTAQLEASVANFTVRCCTGNYCNEPGFTLRSDTNAALMIGCYMLHLLVNLLV